MNDWSRYFNILEEKVIRWCDSFVAMMPNFFLALFVFIIFYQFSKLFSRIAGRLLSRFSRNVSVNALIQGLVQFIVVGIGLFTILEILRLEKTVSSLLAGAGILGLTIGFAFQEIAANFFAGILIAIKKPYKIGDVVETSDGRNGTVTVIDLRTTSIRLAQGPEVIIPNKEMFTKVLTNFTSSPERRVDIKVGVSYGEDLRQVQAVTIKAIEAVPQRLKDRPIQFNYTDFGDSSINFTVCFWVEYPGERNYPEALHEAIILIKEAYDTAGISIPYPVRTLDFGIKGGMSLEECLKSNALSQSQTRDPREESAF